MRVVLPAPFGPSRAKIDPGRDVEVDPVEHGLAAEGLRTPRALTVYVIHRMYIGYTVNVK